MRAVGWAAACTAGVLALTGCVERPATDRPSFVDAEDLPEKLGEDGTTVVVGDGDAVVTVHLYEDPRCPVCREFEFDGGGPALEDAMLRREASAEYTFASFLDIRAGGNGSKKAVNALRAALELGKFVEFHEVLYANQPDEEVDGYTDDFLLKIAEQVEGLRGPEFDAAVRTMKYRSFVVASQKAYERAGGEKEPKGPGTPTAVINGKRIPVEHQGFLMDRRGFGDVLKLILGNPAGWDATQLGEPAPGEVSR
ncbi:DsbA family protein [Streptomyces sp. NPDC014734]|uniref:DsbA family protein n=1 Tax=Streptomyces sp. NPDC014734 TaxID=3364886 RepID=UPI0037011E0A